MPAVGPTMRAEPEVNAPGAYEVKGEAVADGVEGPQEVGAVIRGILNRLKRSMNYKATPPQHQ